MDKKELVKAAKVHLHEWDYGDVMAGDVADFALAQIEARDRQWEAAIEAAKANSFDDTPGNIGYHPALPKIRELMK